MVSEILKKMNISGCENATVEQFKRSEDDSEYKVWKIDLNGKVYVLKKAKEYESEIYSSFFALDEIGAPKLISTVFVEGDCYILMEYIEGRDICHCDRKSLIKALDALIYLQNKYWSSTNKADTAFSFSKSLAHREARAQFLCDAELEGAYGHFLEAYKTLPRTFCHDDLLPFNIIVSEDKATIIDWEIAGILPYPTSFARLIAHTEESNDAFFYMSDEDKQFAINYYYENLVKQHGISYKDYRETLYLFIFYEYCEWIMLGNKYEDADMDMYSKYLKKAKEHLYKGV